MRTAADARLYLVDAFASDALAGSDRLAGDTPNAHYIVTDPPLRTTASATCNIPAARRVIDQTQAMLTTQDATGPFSEYCTFHWSDG